VVRQAHHERNNQDTVKIPYTLSLSKGVFGVLQEARLYVGFLNRFNDSG